MKPAFLSYHGGQLCASLHHPPLSLVLECVLFYIYSHFLLINPYKCTQEKDVLRKRKVKNGTFIESKISQKHSRANSERNRCSRISSYFMALRPFHSKSTNSSIFQVRRWPVMMLAVKMHQPGSESVPPTEKTLPSSNLGRAHKGQQETPENTQLSLSGAELVIWPECQMERDDISLLKLL